MPAAITHFLQAERVMEALDKSGKMEPAGREAFLWGAQGPDFLYCHRVLPWQHGESLNAYGEKLHRELPSKLFDVLREYYYDSGKDRTLLYYLFGFICHYSLDRICHPFIHFGTQALREQYADQNEKDIHSEIESSLDTIMLRYEKAALPIEFNLKRTVPKNKSLQMMIAKLNSHVLELLYGVKIDSDLLYQATEDCRMAYGLLNDRTSWKRNLMERLEKRHIIHSVSCHIRPISEGDQYDYANILKARWDWRNGSGKKCDQSFFELYESSILESEELIGGFFDRDCFNCLIKEIPFV